ncbi:MAG TPA: AtpZ/AtpI family protein [Acidimicrobiia bacterium]|nr:AtpZ/AtpI family protein [Acidimicrobiia bacterium]
MSGSVHRQVSEQAAAVGDSSAFFGSIMAGLLLGALADKGLGTYPLLVVIGIIAGSVVGFWRMWQIATRDDAS